MNQAQRSQLVEEAADALSKARLDLVLDHPFFGALALRLRPVVDWDCDTAWTDGVRLGINPETFMGLTAEQRKGLIAHEVLHCANGHPWRRDSRDEEGWGRACDRAINKIITDAGMELWGDCEMPSVLEEGQSAEVIYAAMQRKPQGQGDQPGDGEGESEKFSDPGAMKTPEGGDGDGKSKDKSQGQSQDGEGDGAGQESKESSSSISATAKEELDNAWKIATIQAAMMAKSRGELPGGIENLIDLVKRAPLDWRAELRRFMQQQAKNDYSWTKPHTRYLARGLYLPALRSEEMGPVVVAVDTSGSISEAEFQKFMDETKSVIEEANPEFTLVMQADAQVNDVKRFERGDFFVPPPVKGRGGTNFNPVFEHVEREGIQPACLIYLTDLEGPYPAIPPDYPVLWVCSTDKEADWGETIRLDIHS
jgi:predicted metal-dependent peptidase